MIETCRESFDEFAWRLLAAGVPLLESTLHIRTIHPQFLGCTIEWWRDTEETTQLLIGYEVDDTTPYAKNPVRLVCEGRETLRRRLDTRPEELDFELLIELRRRGGTDFIALPIDALEAVYMVTFVTDRADGFALQEIDDLIRLSQRLGVVIDQHSRWWINHNVVSAYLGARTGPKVMKGQIRRGRS
jgi:adenylate cyclase